MSDTECVTKLGVGPKERGGIGEQAAVGTSLRLEQGLFHTMARKTRVL